MFIDNEPVVGVGVDLLRWCKTRVGHEPDVAFSSGITQAVHLCSVHVHGTRKEALGEGISPADRCV